MMRFVRFRLHLPLLLVVLVMGGLGVGGAAAQPASISKTTPVYDLRVDVGYLSADVLEGRETGSRGERLAAQYLVERFQEIGLSPGLDTAWTQPFTFTYSPNPHASKGHGESRTGHNVVARLDRGADRTVVVGAHYDHLGYGGVGSRAPGDSLIHNGADDNASGVAAMLEIARQLKASDLRRHNVLFVGFSGEELGLYGSKHFVKHLPVPAEQVNYMINLDMVGRLGEKRALAVNGTGTSPAWSDALRSAATATNLTLAETESGIGASDHTSFYLEDIPALHLFTGAHNDYHTPTDDSQKIDYDGLRDVATFAVRLIEQLDDDGALAFRETDDEDRRQGMSFKVSLGIMPDYAFGGDGMRIDAVLDGPAARNDFKEGDVIVRVGDTDVDDIYAYMDGLKQLEPGETATVVVRRGEKTLTKEVTF